MSASNSYDPINILDSTNAIGVGTGGSLTVGGGISIGRDTFVGGNLHISGTTTSFSDNILLLNRDPQISTDTGMIFQRFSGDSSTGNLYSGLLYSEASDEFRLGWLGSDPSTGSVEFSGYAPLRLSSLLSGALNTIGPIFTDTNLVGINKTSPAYALDVVGSIRSSSSILADWSTIGSFVSTTLSTGSLQISGTIDSTNASTGALVSYGGISIIDTVNASNASNGGALTVAGGGAIGGNLFLGGSVFAPSGTIANLVVTNVSTGTVRAATGVITNISNTNITTGTLRATTGVVTNISNTSITSGTIRATTTLIATGTVVATNTSNTLGSIVTTGGNIGIGTVAPTSRLHVIGNGLFTSTENATGVGTGGSLTVGGGASISSDLYVGGNIFGNALKVSVQSTSFTVATSDRNTYFQLSGSITVTLPAANTVGRDFLVGFVKTDSISNQITLAPSTGTVNGRSNYVLSTLDESIFLISDGTNWRSTSVQNFVFANVYSIPGSYTFTVPNPVTNMYACVFGAGGGGGSGAASGSGNGGGGGGYAEGTISVSPGDTLTITVGEGGSADTPGANSSVGDLLATGGGAGGTNSSGSWGSNGSAGSGSGGVINRSGGTGGQSPSQTSGGGGGGGAAGRTSSGSNGNGYLGGNGSGGSGGSGVITAGGSVRVANFYREGGGGASGNLSGTSSIGAVGGYPGGGGSGSAGGNTAGNGGDGAVVIFY